jgi:hypothetical protein
VTLFPAALTRRAALALVVLVAVVPAVATAKPAKKKKSSGTFLALTYNVAGLPQNISGSDPETNSPLISPLLNDYDLVLLQEDWADPPPGIDLFFHEEVTADAKHKYRSEPATAPMGLDFRRAPTGPPLIADGLNRLSDFPFGPIDRQMWEACFGEFSLAAVNAIADATGLDAVIEEAGLSETLDDGSADCGAQKGFEFARVTFAKGVEVDVYNLHADAGGDPRDQAARVANFAQLADYIKKTSAGRAVIVGGDTNLHTEVDSEREVDVEVWQTFRQATGLVDVCTALDCGADFGAIDKFAFRSSKHVKLAPLSAKVDREKFTRADGEPMSDHDPLALRFRWKKR